MDILQKMETPKHNPILKAKTIIEERLWWLEEKLSIYALQASLAWDHTWKIVNADIVQKDDFEKKNSSDIQRFYTVDSYRAYWKREFILDCMWTKTPISYDFAQKIDDNWNLRPIYDRFSEKYTATIWNKQFSFENIEDCINFTYHIHRATYFRKQQKPVTFMKIWENIYTQTVTKDKSWNMKIVKKKYYRKIPDIQKIGLCEEQITHYWNPELRSKIILIPKTDSKWNVTVGTTSIMENYYQWYTNDYQQQNTTKNTLTDTEIKTMIIDILNTY
jgi:hypothetical protein